MAPLPAALPPLPGGLDLERFLQNLTDPMNVIDRDYRVVWTNDPDPGPGLPSLRAEGKICYRIFMGREELCEECPVREVFETGRPAVMEKRVEFDSGYLLHTEVWAYPIRSPEGRVDQVIKIGHHIAQGREKLDRARGEAAAGPATEGDSPGETEPCQPLSPRELEVLVHLARGLTNVEIAEALEISPHTVKTHVISLFNKFGTTKRTETAVRAVRLGLI